MGVDSAKMLKVAEDFLNGTMSPAAVSLSIEEMDTLLELLERVGAERLNGASVERFKVSSASKRLRNWAVF